MLVKEFGTQNKEVLILLHGGGLSWWNYQEATKLLAEQYHVVLPVLDGHGGSEVPFHSIEENARHIFAMIKERFSGRVAAIAGVSLGGQIAAELLSMHPEVCRFALLESTLVKPMALTYRLIKPTYEVSYGMIQQKWFAKLQADYLGIPKDLFEDYFQDTCKISKTDMIAFLEANSNYKIKAGLSKTRAKVLILAGSREIRQIRDSAVVLQNTIPNSQMKILPGYRHGEFSLNHPAEFAALLSAGLDTKEEP